MWEQVREAIGAVLGLDVSAHDLAFRHMAARALVVFSFGVMLARIADRRMLAHNAGFDIVILVVLGSVLSRGINGGAAFFPSLGASAVLVALHHVVATIAFRSHAFSQWLKGKPRVLVRDGRPDRRELRRNKFTDADLDESLRLNGGVAGTGEVAEARLERNGSVSVVKTKSRARE
jgi:uncharacterized membrane protein YcaP (DUF421 family)